MRKPNSFRYFKTSPKINCLAVLMHVRFPLSLRNAEDLLHERSIDIGHETVRFWWIRFGSLFAAQPVRIELVGCVHIQIGSGTWMSFREDQLRNAFFLAAVDHEGEVLELYDTKCRDRGAASKFLTKLMKRLGQPEIIATDKLRSRAAAMKIIGCAQRQETGRCLNNPAENSPPLTDSGLLANHEKEPFRRQELAIHHIRQMRSLQ